MTNQEKRYKPTVLWFTGLSGSGKSTISERVYEILGEQGYEVEHLDGDAVRDIFPKTGFSREERNEHIKRVGYLASRLQTHGIFVIGSFISPYQEARDFVRDLCDDFTEIYISTPLEECERRDVKGLYDRARKGEITQFTGIDDPYEAPENPELSINTMNMSIEDSVEKVLSFLSSRAK